MDNQLQTIITEQNVAKENAATLIAAFGAPFTEAGEILSTYKDIEVTDETQKDLMQQAKTKRLALKKVRTTVENKRKELKEDSLRTGKAIDGVAKYIKDTIQPAEAYLELQEKFAENKEAERVLKLKAERVEKLLPLCDNPYVYTLDVMSDTDFDKLYTELKEADDLKKAQAEVYEREQERLRAEKEAEDARIREENEILRKQAEAREAEIAKEREEQRKVQEAELAAERAKLEEERVKREAIEKEQREAREAEESARKQAEESAKAELLAPDKQKLLSFATALDTIKNEKLPAVKSNEAQKVVNLIEEMLTKMKNTIEEKAKNL